MKLQAKASLLAFNSFGFESTADELVVVHDVGDLTTALATLEPLTILGEGTNVVLKPRILGRVIRLALRWIEVDRRAEDDVLVTVGAGVNWHELVRHTLGLGIGGLENLALIPGSVGAAPYQNIGAYGVELHQVIDSVRVFDRTDGVVKDRTGSECKFSYRSSTFRSTEHGRYVICGVTLRLGGRGLTTGYRDVERAVFNRSLATLNAAYIAETVIRIRRQKLPDPRRIGNAGSFFKNPILSAREFDALQSKVPIDGHRELGGVKVSAARLIDVAGWKGFRSGAAEVWHRQPLVLVNHGSASAREVLDLAERIAGDVHRRYGIELELEPEVLGSF